MRVTWGTITWTREQQLIRTLRSMGQIPSQLHPFLLLERLLCAEHYWRHGIKQSYTSLPTQNHILVGERDNKISKNQQNGRCTLLRAKEKNKNQGAGFMFLAG